MNSDFMRIIAHYNSKILLRSWLFRLFYLFAFGCIVFLQLHEQSNLFGDETRGLFSLPCYIPYLNAYLFILFQLIPVVFLVNSFYGKRHDVDTMDAIYYRPASNAEFVWGTSWGIARVFFCTGVISLVLAGVIHVFVSLAPFDIRVYFFYLFSLILLALIFTLGFSCFVAVLVRNRALVLLILGGYFILMICYVGDYRQGLFDPLGGTLPNVISDISGHSDLSVYFLQRVCWLFLGLGFTQLAVLLFPRMHSGVRVKQIGGLVIFMCIGLGCGVSVFTIQQKKIHHREIYAATYDKYVKVPKATLLQQDITYRQQGTRLRVNTTLVVKNQTAADLNEVILYLNPSLEVARVAVGDKELAFQREHQVIRVQTPLTVGDSLRLDVIYEGKIDEDICYLDISDKALKDIRFRVKNHCRYGERYIFVHDDFTLLIPEALWYPVTLPPVNPKSPYDIPKNFTNYTLRVANPRRKTVISQGNRSFEDTTVLFQAENPLCGLSLCIGDYQTYSYTWDSVRYELNVFSGHTSLFPELETFGDNQIIDVISKARKEIEKMMGKTYPYHRFVLTESPVTFASYFRNGKGSSEYVQPEQVFFPERGQNYWRRQDPGRYDVEMSNFVYMFTQKEEFQNPSSLVGDFLKPFRSPFQSLPVDLRCNSYGVSAMFHNYQSSVKSDVYPIMDAVIHQILLGDGQSKLDLDNSLRQEAIDYLACHSMQEAVGDEALPSAVFAWILALKTKELVNIFKVRGIEPRALASFISGYLSGQAFREIEFKDFNEAFIQEFGIDWFEIIPQWYTVDKIPGYIVKDFISYPIMSSVTGQYDSGRVEIAIYNDSDVDGIVNLQSAQYEEAGYSGIVDMGRGNQVFKLQVYDRVFLIPARTAKRIAFVRGDYMSALVLNTGISENIPIRVDPEKASVMKVPDFSEYFQDMDAGYFLPAPGEIIVDNESSGCKVTQSSESIKLVDYFIKKKPGKEREEALAFLLIPSDRWKMFIRPQAYGTKVCSGLYRKAGKGESFVEWNVDLDKKGDYELFVYLPGTEIGGMPMMSNPMDKTLEMNQTYYISTATGEKEASIDTYRKQGWFPLGTYTCDSGPNKIVLSDKGHEKQIIVGDAVKWVYVGEKGPVNQ